MFEFFSGLCKLGGEEKKKGTERRKKKEGGHDRPHIVLLSSGRDEWHREKKAANKGKKERSVSRETSGRAMSLPHTQSPALTQEREMLGGKEKRKRRMEQALRAGSC